MLNADRATLFLNDEKYTDYGKHYKNYTDIHAGQYMYYLDKDIDPTYSLPVYTVRSQVNSEVYQTPMGSLWPRYPKVPTTKDSRYLSSVGYVHKDNLVGKAQFIFFSSDRSIGSIFSFCKWNKSIRFDRFFQKIK